MTSTDNAPLTTPFTSRYADGVTEWEEVMGYRIPLTVDGLDAEYHALRNDVIAQDYSMLYKTFVEGPDARTTVDALFSRDVRELPVGHILYGVIVNDDGGMVDDVTVAVLADDRLLVVGGTTQVTDDLRGLAPAGTTVEERRSSLGVLTVQGPKSRELLQRLTDADLSNETFPFYTARTDVVLAGVPVTILRIGFHGELGYEVLVPADQAGVVYDAVYAQKDLGVSPYGGFGLMVARIEAGFMLAGADYDPDVSPFECRLGWAVDLDKNPFRGQEALKERKATAPTRVVGVTAAVSPETLEGAELQLDGEVVGVVTMAVTSPVLDGATVGFARVAKAAAGVGTALRATVDGAEIDVEVRATPIYEAARARQRS